MFLFSPPVFVYNNVLWYRKENLVVDPALGIFIKAHQQFISAEEW